MGCLGALLGRFEALLGASRAVLARAKAILSRLEALLGPQKGQKSRIIDFLLVFIVFEAQKGSTIFGSTEVAWPLGGVRGGDIIM